MPKAKKTSKKDTSSFIKKVASAGRRGDTELAYLSPKARDLLKKLGGSGTRNPRTDLKEFFLPGVPQLTPEQIAQLQQQFGQPAAPAPPVGSAAADMTAVSGPRGRTGGMPPATQPFQSIAPPAPTPPAPTAQAPRTAAQELEAFAGRPLTPPTQQYEDMSQREREAEITRQMQEAEAARAAQQRAAQEAAARRAQEQAAREAAQRAAQEQAAREAAQRAAQEQARAAQELEALRQAEAARIAQAERIAAQARAAQEAAARAAQQTAPQGGAASERAREDLTLTPGANRPGQNIFDADVTGCPPGHYFNPISQSCVPLPSNFDWRLGGSPADAARRAQEELDRRAQEEAARKAAEEEAARRAAEEAARKAAEEEAQRRAAEEAARVAAEEEARRRAEQDAQARRAAEEAARVAEEARRRQAEAEAARIAEEERRRREQEARAALPPPSPAPPSTPIPPGLVESPLPTPPPPAGTIPGDRGPRTHIFIDENRNGIDDRDEAPADTPRRGIRTPGSPPGGSDMRTGDFIDENLNGIDDRDEGKRESPGSGGFFDWTGAVDPNSDIGRLIARLRERGGKVGRGGRGGTPGTQPPQTGGGRPSPPPPPVFSPLPPREPGSIPLPDSGYVPTPIPTPGYIAAPLPQMPGAGTGTPFFNPNTGGLTPGTIPVSSDLPSLRTSDLPLQAIGQNPNLSPRVLGGEENLGYYTDRFGNIILSPGAVRPPGFAKGGSADADLLKELEEFREAEGLKDIDSARAMLERLSNEPATSSTEVSVSPLAQSVKRTSRTPIRQQTDRGTAKGMAMELEEVTQSRDQGPRTKRQTEDLRQRMELLRNTLGMPTLSKATLAREGDLMARRFNEGGDVKKKQDETATAPGVRRTLPLQVRTYLESVRDPRKRTQPISEKDLDQEELDKLRDVIELAERSGIAPPGVVNYDVHELQRRQTMGATPIADTDFSIFPSANLRNTFGQFTFERLPDGTLIVKDSYDYEGDVGEKFNPLIRYANKKGVDRPVNIRIPPVKRAEGSPEEGETTEDFIRRLEEYTPYNLMGRAAEGLRNQVTGLVELPGAALDFGRGALQKVRELSPEEFRGSAPAMDTQSVDAFIAAAQRAKEDPKGEAAKMLASVGDYLKEGTSSPGNFAQMLGENLPLPGPRTGTGPRTDVVRPRGEGIVLDYPDAPLVSLTDKNKTLDEAYGSTRLPKGYISRAIDKGKDAIEAHVTVEDVAKREAITDFLETKVRKYFANQYGTKDDPVFKAIKEGRLSTIGLGGPEGIREYLPKVAREGKTRVNPETGEGVFYPSSSARAALEDMSRIYDRMTGLKGTVFADRTIGRPDYENIALDVEKQRAEQLKQETVQRLIDEGVPPYEINARLSLMGYKDPSFAEKNPPRRRAILTDITRPSDDIEALFLADRENLPKSIKVAIEKGQPIYDIEPSGPLASLLDTRYLVEHLASLPIKDIKRLRFDDAIKSTAKERELVESRQALVQRIRSGQPVDSKVFLQGVSEPLLKYEADSAFPGFTWRQIKDPEATAVEGAYIGHSVGGYAKGGAYGPNAREEFLSGDTKIYTLRDSSGKPLTTVEVKEITGRGPIATQIKGAGSKSGNAGDKTPYDALLVDLFNKLGIVGITENDKFLPPLSRAYKQQRSDATNVQLRARLGAPQPVGGAAPARQGIEQLPVPNPPPQRDPREMLAERFLPALPPMPRSFAELNNQFQQGRISFMDYVRMLRRMRNQQGE
jgi:hypothetical protein